MSLEPGSASHCVRQRASCVSRPSFAALSKLHDLSSKDPRKPRGQEFSPMRLLLILLVLVPIAAQTLPAESPVPTPEVQLTGFVELGYRWRTDVSGSFDTYRSVVDLGSGPKLLRTEFTFEDP